MNTDTVTLTYQSGTTGASTTKAMYLDLMDARNGNRSTFALAQREGGQEALTIHCYCYQEK